MFLFSILYNFWTIPKNTSNTCQFYYLIFLEILYFCGGGGGGGLAWNMAVLPSHLHQILQNSNLNMQISLLPDPGKVFRTFQTKKIVFLLNNPPKSKWVKLLWLSIYKEKQQKIQHNINYGIWLKIWRSGNSSKCLFDHVECQVQEALLHLLEQLQHHHGPLLHDWSPHQNPGVYHWWHHHGHLSTQVREQNIHVAAQCSLDNGYVAAPWRCGSLQYTVVDLMALWICGGSLKMWWHFGSMVALCRCGGSRDDS